MTAAEELHAIRLAAIRDGTWPDHSIDAWRQHAHDARQRRANGHDLTDLDHRAIEVDLTTPTTP
jgi:hypothetical protein